MQITYQTKKGVGEYKLRMVITTQSNVKGNYNSGDNNTHTEKVIKVLGEL